MTPATDKPAKLTCFVVMGFGKKTDFETGRILDLDASYQNLIKPAVQAAGLTCLRADEIVHSGLIDVPMYQQLLNADVVVADLSTSNKNAYYELGIRHALRPSTTVIIAEDGIKAFPFDVNHVAVRQYRHLGEDIGSSEARRFTAVLQEAIEKILARQPDDRRDSPVYTFLDLLPPRLRDLERQTMATLAQAAPPTDVAPLLGAFPAGAFAGKAPDDNDLNPHETAVAAPAPGTGDPTHAVLMAEVERQIQQSAWAQARLLLEMIRAQQVQAREAARKAATVAVSTADHEDPYLLQRLALVTYKSRQPTEQAALLAARDLLLPLEPATTNDTETLGLWGAIHKRLWDLARRPATGPGQTPIQDLDEAVRAYERGFYLRNDYYNGINLAFMLNLRAAEQPASADAVADFVQARRVRREVLDICTRWLAAHAAPDDAPADTAAHRKEAATFYWVLATQAEAYVGLGREAEAQQVLTRNASIAPEAWMPDSTYSQLDRLRAALAANPLQYLQTAG